MKKTTARALVDKIKSMNVKNIIIVMVESLRKPQTKIDMGTWGEKYEDCFCYGCAATNTICKIGGLKPMQVLKEQQADRYGFGYIDINDEHYIWHFEIVVDLIRQALFEETNRVLIKYLGIDPMPESLIEKFKNLPILGNNYTSEELDEYEKFANSL